MESSAISDQPLGSKATPPPQPAEKSKSSKQAFARHMYTNEEHRFVWYKREVLKMTAKKTHQAFHDYFNPEATVSYDGLNQLFGRLKRTLPNNVISVENNEPWATKRVLAAEVKADRGIIDNNSSSDDEGDGGEGSPHNITKDGLDNQSTVSTRTAPAKFTRHMYTNEEHRFVWFYRNVLKMDSMQTYKMFKEYFNVPNMKRTTLNQLAGRLRKQQLPEVVEARHTEPWALGRIPPKIQVKRRNSEVSGQAEVDKVEEVEEVDEVRHHKRRKL